MAQKGRTIEQLVGEVNALLAELAPEQTRYKVTERPDVRTIRYYTSQGLLPRPSYEGGRACYEGSHLLRLLVIKKLQAEHHTLRKIKAELKDKSDAQLLALLQVSSSASRSDATQAADPRSEAPANKRSPLSVVPRPTAPAWSDGQLVRRLELASGLVVERDEQKLDSDETKRQAARALMDLARALETGQAGES
jgi:DNA-binding transcriptional MerR regulator